MSNAIKSDRCVEANLRKVRAIAADNPALAAILRAKAFAIEKKRVHDAAMKRGAK